MSLAVLAAGVIVALALGYTLYGRFIARQYALDDTAPTPAERFRDDLDFTPTRPFYLLGQHFSAIAAAGPIVGPILACLLFGWVPCVLWIVLGVIFIGAVHDFSALVASVRHDGKTIAEIVRVNLGHRAWLAIMVFIWVALQYVLVAFVDVTASTFVGQTQDFEGVSFNAGGAVAAAAVMYLLLAVVMGAVQRRLDPPLWLLTLVFVPATLVVVWLGTEVSTLLILPQRSWAVAIVGYCFVASLLPVWVLLQPRGYLGGFVLYLALAVGTIGVLFGGFTIEQPAFRTPPESGPLTNLLFPFLFVTIACGACSGFHGLVCSGTTSKQVARESHCHPIGYGAMLLEGFVAIIALATVMIVAPGEGAMPPPGRVYGQGIGRFMTLLTGQGSLLFATTFGAMAFSTFVFDTLDVATRLGRIILQELAGARSRVSGVVATLATVAFPAVFLATAAPPAPGERPAYMHFWTLFGTSNQLLAALTLLGVTVWLKRTGRRAWFTIAPMVLVMSVTVTALVLQIVQGFRGRLSLSVTTMNGVVAALLAALALFLVVEAVRALARRPAATG